jgi:hypothetical protein
VGLFEVSDPSEARGRTITACELSDRGAQRIANELADQTEVQAQMMEVTGTVYQSLAQFDSAGALLEKSIAIRRKLLGDDHPQTTFNLSNLAVLLEAKHGYDEAENLYRDILAKHQRKLGEVLSSCMKFGISPAKPANIAPRFQIKMSIFYFVLLHSNHQSTKTGAAITADATAMIAFPNSHCWISVTSMAAMTTPANVMAIFAADDLCCFDCSILLLILNQASQNPNPECHHSSQRSSPLHPSDRNGHRYPVPRF